MLPSVISAITGTTFTSVHCGTSHSVLSSGLIGYDFPYLLQLSDGDNYLKSRAVIFNKSWNTFFSVLVDYVAMRETAQIAC